MDPGVAAVRDWPAPGLVRQVFAHFYHRFIRNFSAVAAPITALTRKTAPTLFMWTPKARGG